MVKKLYKHEFAAWLRIMPIVWLITLGVAGLHRIIQIFENDSVYFRLVIGSISVVYVLSILACLYATLIYGIVRFYRNFFTGEGYLTFTLPTTQSSLLWVKVSTAVCMEILSSVVCLLSFCVITAGDVLTEIWKAAAYLVKDIPADAAPHLLGWFAEILLLSLVSTFSGFLLYYSCICIGQLARKNRILAAIGAYVAYYIIVQILSTGFSLSLAFAGTIGSLEDIYQAIAAHPLTFVHIVFLGSAALSALVGWIYWLICHHIISKKLNLE